MKVCLKLRKSKLVVSMRMKLIVLVRVVFGDLNDLVLEMIDVFFFIYAAGSRVILGCSFWVFVMWTDAK